MFALKTLVHFDVKSLLGFLFAFLQKLASRGRVSLQKTNTTNNPKQLFLSKRNHALILLNLSDPLAVEASGAFKDKI